MRYLVIVFLLFSLGAYAQEPTYVPMKSNYLFKGIKMDSLFILPVLDTANARKVNGNLVRQSDAYYWYDSTKWTPLVTGGGGSTDTTSLSNRINQKVDSINRIGDSVYFYKNGIGYYAFKDSVGNVSGFVPYTGATQDVDLGNNGLDARFIKIEGTAGTGHIDLKHQSSDGSAQGNSSILYANSQGYLKWKNDNLYYSTLAMPQTADRVYTYQNKNYTLGDSADIEARVKYTDTANMLNPYLRKADTSSLSNRINLKLNISDTANMLAPYLREADTTSLSNRINTKLNISDTASMLTNYQRTSSFPIAIFGGGSGVAGDTSVFTTSAIYGAFYNDGVDTIILTGYRAIVQGTSASVTPTIYWNDTLSTTVATKAVNSPSAVTSTTTGNNVTSLDNTKIPPGNWAWVQTGTVTTKPTFFSLTLFGYRKRP